MRRTKRTRTGQPLAGASPLRESQACLWGDGEEPGPGGAALVPTRVLLKHRSSARVLDQIRQVRFFFPELAGVTIRVGLTRAAEGYASSRESTIWMNPYRLCYHTIAHELVHLLQNRGLVPGGEKSADLHALARHVVLVDALPHYLRIPANFRRLWAPGNPFLPRLIHRTARAAVEAPDRGPRQRVRWFEDTLRSRWDAARRELLSRTTHVSQLCLLGEPLPA